MKCPWCRTKMKATVFHNRIRWMHRFACGHINVAGYTMPPNVLKDQGLANYKLDESPTYEWENRRKRMRERQKIKSYEDFMRHEDTRSSKERYTPISKGTMQISRRPE